MQRAQRNVGAGAPGIQEAGARESRCVVTQPRAPRRVQKKAGAKNVCAEAGKRRRWSRKVELEVEAAGDLGILRSSICANDLPRLMANTSRWRGVGALPGEGLREPKFSVTRFRNPAAIFWHHVDGPRTQVKSSHSALISNAPRGACVVRYGRVAKNNKNNTIRTDRQAYSGHRWR
eukprot:6142562-Prymnesium_polylepis.1